MMQRLIVRLMRPGSNASPRTRRQSSTISMLVSKRVTSQSSISTRLACLPSWPLSRSRMPWLVPRWGSGGPRTDRPWRTTWSLFELTMLMPLLPGGALKTGRSPSPWTPTSCVERGSTSAKSYSAPAAKRTLSCPASASLAWRSVASAGRSIEPDQSISLNPPEMFPCSSPGLSVSGSSPSGGGGGSVAASCSSASRRRLISSSSWYTSDRSASPVTGAVWPKTA